MTKVGFVTSPLFSGHAHRGIGFYAQLLLTHLRLLAPSLGFEILEIENYSEIGSEKVDIVHFPFFDLFSHTLPLIKKTKTVVTVHDVIPLQFPDHYPPGVRGQLNLYLQRLALAGTDRVLTDSLASIIAIRKYLGVPHRKLRLIYLAAAPHFRPVSDRRLLLSVRNKYHLPAEFVLYVGDINYNKNFPSLVTACANLGIPLVAVGRQAAKIESLDLSHPELAHLSGLDFKSIVRPGFIPPSDLAAVYNLAAVYCQPSYAEGFGLSVAEAMACGTPVAAGNIGPLREIAGDAVVYFDPYNITALKRCLKDLLTNHSLRRRLARAGILQASKFNWPTTARQTLAVYRELV